jgi:ribosomal protein S18 acetylase RimI-like enzyme
MRATIRPYRAQDLGRVLRLWETPAPLTTGDALPVDQAVDLVNSESSITFVAEESAGDIVGVAVGESSSVVGWICKLAVAPEASGQEEIAHKLLDELEGRLADRGAHKLAVLVADGDGNRDNLEQRGYEPAGSLVYLERDIPGAGTVSTAVAEVGGQLVPPGLWESLRGMDIAKEVIERRVVLPLAHPELASRHAVDFPTAILLFGPPGTGKTTFAKGLASRLDWAFVEIAPGELAAEGPDRQAQRLAQIFDRVLTLPSAVVFVDEVEDIASVRHTDRKVRPSVTNEFLKQIPRLRQSARHLLICATNAVGALDPAVLRPGRFGYMLPVGPPDDESRGAIWERFVRDITDEEVDLDALVAASARFTPADIEFAAKKAAHMAFEREHFDNVDHRAVTEDFLAAIGAQRPTVTEEMVEAFRRDAEQYTRF